MIVIVIVAWLVTTSTRLLINNLSPLVRRVSIFNSTTLSSVPFWVESAACWFVLLAFWNPLSLCAVCCLWIPCEFRTIVPYVLPVHCTLCAVCGAVYREVAPFTHSSSSGSGSHADGANSGSSDGARLASSSGTGQTDGARDKRKPGSGGGGRGKHNSAASYASVAHSPSLRR